MDNDCMSSGFEEQTGTTAKKNEPHEGIPRKWDLPSDAFSWFLQYRELYDEVQASL